MPSGDDIQIDLTIVGDKSVDWCETYMDPPNVGSPGPGHLLIYPGPRRLPHSCLVVRDGFEIIDLNLGKSLVASGRCAATAFDGVSPDQDNVGRLQN